MKKSVYTSAPKPSPLSTSTKKIPSDPLHQSHHHKMLHLHKNNYLMKQFQKPRFKSTQYTSSSPSPSLTSTRDTAQMNEEKREVIMRKLRDSLRGLKVEYRKEEELWEESMGELRGLEGVNGRLKKGYRGLLQYVNKVHKERERREREAESSLKRANSITKKQLISVEQRLLEEDLFPLPAFSPTSQSERVKSDAKEIKLDFDKSPSIIHKISLMNLIESNVGYEEEEEDKLKKLYSTEDVIPVTVGERERKERKTKGDLQREQEGEVDEFLLDSGSFGESGKWREESMREIIGEAKGRQGFRKTNSIIIPSRYSSKGDL